MLVSRESESFARKCIQSDFEEIGGTGKDFLKKCFWMETDLTTYLIFKFTSLFQGID